MIKHTHDLSQMGFSDFVDALMLAIHNIHDATAVGGYYAILCGNQRKNGKYRNISSLIERLAPANLSEEIIKMQHNCISDSRSYGKLVRISHEKLLLFKKESFTSGFAIKQAEVKAKACIEATWLSVIRRLLQQHTMMTTQELFLELSLLIDAANPLNKSWEQRIKVMLQNTVHFNFDKKLDAYQLQRY